MVVIAVIGVCVILAFSCLLVIFARGRERREEVITDREGKGDQTRRVEKVKVSPYVPEEVVVAPNRIEEYEVNQKLD